MWLLWWRSWCGGQEEARNQEVATSAVFPAEGTFIFIKTGTNNQRFAHNATSSKVETPVRFPSRLNMRPYVEPVPANASESDKDLPLSLYAYDLFAVVTHEGKLDNGHYWADVRSGDEWWHCDDDKGECVDTHQRMLLIASVTPTTLAGALGQKAYMLFYVRRSLAYGQPMSKLLAVNGNANGNANGNGA